MPFPPLCAECPRRFPAGSPILDQSLSSLSAVGLALFAAALLALLVFFRRAPAQSVSSTSALDPQRMVSASSTPPPSIVVYRHVPHPSDVSSPCSTLLCAGSGSVKRLLFPIRIDAILPSTSVLGAPSLHPLSSTSRAFSPQEFVYWQTEKWTD